MTTRDSPFLQLREAAMDEFTRALAGAIQLISLQGEELRHELFPLWRKATHRILQRLDERECSRSNVMCFLSLTDDEQLRRFVAGHSLSFDEFVRVFEEGRAVALTTLASSKHDACIQ